MDYNLITVAEFGAYAPEVDTSAYGDPTISGMISMASKQVADYIGYTPIAEFVVDEVREGHITSEGDLIVFPAKLPIQTISEISITKGTTDLPLSLTDGNGNIKYNIDYNKRKVRFPNFETAFNNVPGIINFYGLKNTQFFTKMSYLGGWNVEDLPETIKLATILYMRDVLGPASNPNNASRIKQGLVEFEYRNSAIMNGEDSIFVKQANKLLGPYRRIG